MSLGKNRRLLVLAVLVALVATLVAALWISQLAPRQTGEVDCGTARASEPWVFNCLMKAYHDRGKAKGMIVASTLEGDSVVYTLTLVSPSSLHVVIDNRDRYGQPGVYMYSCSGMTRIDQYRISLNGCSGNGPLGPGLTLSVPS
jgi:hypothetical protein